MIATVTFNPSLDKTATVDGLIIDEANRWTNLCRDPGDSAVAGPVMKLSQGAGLEEALV